MDALDLLAQDNYIIVNKTLIKEIGLENSVIIGVMCGYQRGFKSDFFYREQEKMMEDTGLTEYSIRKGIKELVDYGFLETKKMGMPGKIYYHVNLQKFNFLSSRGCENDTSRGCENDTSIINNNNINNKYNKNNINKNESINKENPKESKFEEILEFWNSKCIIKHKINDDIKNAIFKALSNNTMDEIKLAIEHYKEVIASEFYFNYKWSLVDFLNRKNGYKTFLDDGTNWINYLEWKNNPKPQCKNSKTVEKKELSEFEKNWFKEQDEKFWGKKQ